MVSSGTSILRAGHQMLFGKLLLRLYVNSYLCIHTWGLRSIPSLVRRQKDLACHPHMSCHRCYQNLPWSSCPRTSQLCGNKGKMKVCEVQSLGFHCQTHMKNKLLCGLFNILYPPNKSCSRSVDQMPSVGSEVFPAHIFWVMPESADLKQGEINSPELIFLQKPTLKSSTGG